MIESPLKPEEHCAPVASPAGAGGSPREALGSTDFESTGPTLAAAAEEALAGGERDGRLVFGKSCSSALELMSEECEEGSLALAGVEFLRCKVQPEQTVKLVTAVAVATKGSTNELNCRSADESEWSEPECVIVLEQWEEAERSCKQRFHTMSTLRESKPEHEQRARLQSKGSGRGRGGRTRLSRGGRSARAAYRESPARPGRRPWLIDGAGEDGPGRDESGEEG